MIFDTHAHYDDEVYDMDLEDVLNEQREKGVEKIVNISANFNDIYKIIEISDKYDYIYRTLGVHPDYVDELDDSKIDIMRKLGKNNKVVAIGEIGLDYYGEEIVDKKIQKKWFIEQIKLSKELNLPIVVHSRDACCDTLSVIKEYESCILGGIIHCFSYSKEIALEYINMGFYIGIGGVVTFKNGKVLKEVVENIPLESIVLETDAPYLSPVPFRGKRNESKNIKYVIDEISRLKNIPFKEVEKITYNNAIKVYNL